MASFDNLKSNYMDTILVVELGEAVKRWNVTVSCSVSMAAQTICWGEMLSLSHHGCRAEHRQKTLQVWTVALSSAASSFMDFNRWGSNKGRVGSHHRSWLFDLGCQVGPIYHFQLPLKLPLCFKPPIVSIVCVSVCVISVLVCGASFCLGTLWISIYSWEFCIVIYVCARQTVLCAILSRHVGGVMTYLAKSALLKLVSLKTLSLTLFLSHTHTRTHTHTHTRTHTNTHSVWDRTCPDSR